MRRFTGAPMTSRLFYFAVAVSLGLSVGAAALCARSYWCCDGIWYSTDTSRYSLHSHHGRIWFWSLAGGRAALDAPLPTAAQLHRGIVWDSTPDSYYDGIGKRTINSKVNAEQFTFAAPAVASRPAAVDWQVMGFRYLRNNSWLPLAQVPISYPTARSLAIFVPHWAIALLLLILPSFLLLRVLQRRRRVLHGLCPACGYDLRASPDCCPECGTPSGRREAATA